VIPRVLLTGTGGEVVEVLQYHVEPDRRSPVAHAHRLIALVVTRRPAAMFWVDVSRLTAVHDS
jgi:hypothetical protein